MESNLNPDRHVVKKRTLAEESGDSVLVGESPADRIMMMWQIAQDCWTFVPGADVKREFQRHIAHIERRTS